MIPQLSFRFSYAQIPWRSAAWCVFVVFWRTTEKDPLKSSIKSPGARNVCSPVAAAFACTSSFAVACLTKHGHVSALVRCLGSLWGWCTDRFGGR